MSKWLVAGRILDTSDLTKPLWKRKVQLRFGSGILAFLVAGVFSYRGMIESGESDQWVRHTHEVLLNLQDFRFAIERLDSGCRGFRSTGPEFYAESYRANRLGAKQGEATVRNDEAGCSNPLPSTNLLWHTVNQESHFRESVPVCLFA